MSKNYIILNGKPFKFMNRDYKEIDIGGDWKTLLNGNVTRDYSVTVGQWVFQIHGIDKKTLDRLKAIYDLKTSFSFTDYDNETYTVVWFATEFSYEERYPDVFNIEVSLREVIS